MKRHPELLNLSREHYAALKLARDARRAAESGDSVAICQLSQRVVDTFANELDPHFRHEEEGVFPYLAQSGRDDLVQQALSDHAALRALASTLHVPQASALLRFAELMAAHVRFEERELFETAQSLLESTGQATFPQEQRP